MFENDSTFQIPVAWKTDVHIGLPTNFSLNDTTVFKTHTVVEEKKPNPFDEYMSLEKIILSDYVFIGMIVFALTVWHMLFGWGGMKPYKEIK